METNPILAPSSLPYQAIRFDLIKLEHYEPAFDMALKEHTKEIEKMANNSEPATFENTLVALETSGKLLDRVANAFFPLTSANTNPTLQNLEEKYAPILSAHSDSIYLNSKLYQRLLSIPTQTLKGEDLKLYQEYKSKFEKAGANLNEQEKTHLKSINQELSILTTQFGNLLLEARKNAALMVDTPQELEGLSNEALEVAQKKAKEAGHPQKYLLNITNTTQQPLLQNLKNRTTREKLYHASMTRAEKGDAADTRSVIEKIAKLRLKKAKLLGKRNFSEWKLQDQMAKTPQHAMDLLKKITPAAIQQANHEKNELQKLIDETQAQQGLPSFTLKPWDWEYYANLLKQKKYSFNEDELKPYLEVKTVLEKGAFFAAQKMYGLTFKPRTDIPTYHPEVITYEVFNEKNEPIALYYLDFYTRDNKSGGAWMGNFLAQSHVLHQKPIIYNVYNFSKPLEGKPALISFDDVITIFHEFGHTLHGLFANQKYASLSGTETPSDFVELPSQINEHAALDPEILKNYAVHYQTKAPIPQKLIDQMLKAHKFNKGYEVTELMAATWLDLEWHLVENENDFKPVTEFEAQALKKHQLNLEVVPPRYKTSYFNHIWSGGYASGYYAYTWSKTLDYNIYDWFKAHGGFTRKNGEHFKNIILSVGNSVDLNEAVKKMIGHEMKVEPYLKNTF